MLIMCLENIKSCQTILVSAANMLIFSSDCHARYYYDNEMHLPAVS